QELTEQLIEQGHWLELNELCLTIGSSDLIESVRGRSLRSSHTLSQAIARVRRSAGAAAVIVDFCFHRVRANHAALGTSEGPHDAWTIEQLGAARVRSPGTKGIFRLLSWGALVRAHTEAGDLGREFEAI